LEFVKSRIAQGDSSSTSEFHHAFHLASQHNHQSRILSGTSNEVVVICGTFYIMQQAREALGLEQLTDGIDLNEQGLVPQKKC